MGSIKIYIKCWLEMPFSGRAVCPPWVKSWLPFPELHISTLKGGTYVRTDGRTRIWSLFIKDSHGGMWIHSPTRIEKPTWATLLWTEKERLSPLIALSTGFQVGAPTADH